MHNIMADNRNRPYMKHIPIICFCLLLCILLSACQQAAFDGSRVKNETEFTLSFRSFNGAEFHTFDLDKGDGIWVEIDCEEGALSVTIQKEDYAPVYSGAEPLSDGFKVEIQESGTYQITVTGEHAKGRAAFSVIVNQ